MYTLPNALKKLPPSLPRGVRQAFFSLPKFVSSHPSFATQPLSTVSKCKSVQNPPKKIAKEIASEWGIMESSTILPSSSLVMFDSQKQKRKNNRRPSRKSNDKPVHLGKQY